MDKDREPIAGLHAAGLTAGGTNGEGIFNATVLSSLGLAFSTGWIAGDNATTATPSHQPRDMTIESEVGAQRMLYKLNQHYPASVSARSGPGSPTRRGGSAPAARTDGHRAADQA